MRLQVLPRLAAEALPPDPRGVVISVTNPRQAPADLDGWTEVLRLGFHDIEEPAPGWKPMTLEQARAVLHFAHRHRSASLLLVHCEHGASRSAAIAAFLAAWAGGTFQWSGDGVPNPWVLRQLGRAARQHALPRPWLWLRLLRTCRAMTSPTSLRERAS
jgi:hypothetical protein